MINYADGAAACVKGKGAKNELLSSSAITDATFAWDVFVPAGGSAQRSPRKDKDGFIYIVDRKKDMFISGGENVFPVEVETAIADHPGVKDAAVIGVPHPKWGEVGKAFVILKEGNEVSEDDLPGFLGQRLARYKIPASYKFVDIIPKSPVGKILKKELKDEQLIAVFRSLLI